MSKFALILLLSILTSCMSSSSRQEAATKNSQKTKPVKAIFPVKGLSIKSPKPASLDRFVKFIDEELSSMGVNTIMLRIGYDYQYSSHPELVNEGALSNAEAKRIVAVCKKHDIKLIPAINLLGHQSWHSKVYKLLEVYPQFDETPHVKLPEKYEWPNADKLYCKSYCPEHPDVHKVVFALIDELVAVCEADSFHAGMDEVFYLGDDKCPRCAGKDKAKLFADEVIRIHSHLKKSNTKMWMWGDRLIDGKATAMGFWEASENGTHRAIDLIPKDITIADWHYERADPTAVLFAAKGFDVVTVPWRLPDVTIEQLNQTISNRKNSADGMKQRFQGMMLTSWYGPDSFMDRYYQITENTLKKGDSMKTFKLLFEQINQLEKSP
ncbi:family 20 glycosylhydrolase [Lentisphaera profundi]|uniref:Family 20 glycosylhydrolase n=1 Tax=Lentisphaera profundi TaxID=1658616 RepID=A0ABY7VSK3_9BACT|nr:family 20 glycosylhydrolase [Lentisphaera profundi]WDE95754.1 family 20 glycosylhydrolase [Lentisphaera profundi]